MSDDELLQSLDTYACQLREANAQLIYAAKARIEALRGEVERLKVHRDAVAKTHALGLSEFERMKTERDRLKAALEKVKMFIQSRWPDIHNSEIPVAIIDKALGGDA